jgi:two-component system, chemotaxis family, chemotaxis protein CheY
LLRLCRRMCGEAMPRRQAPPRGSLLRLRRRMCGEAMPRRQAHVITIWAMPFVRPPAQRAKPEPRAEPKDSPNSKRRGIASPHIRGGAEANIRGGAEENTGAEPKQTSGAEPKQTSGGGAEANIRRRREANIRWRREANIRRRREANIRRRREANTRAAEANIRAAEETQAAQPKKTQAAQQRKPWRRSHNHPAKDHPLVWKRRYILKCVSSSENPLIRIYGGPQPIERMPAADSDTAESSAVFQRALILVVERNPVVQRLERYFLEHAGYTVEFASDGQKALERARELKPGIIVTEIMVPVLDGLSLCREIKSNPETAHARVLIFSHLSAEDRAREVGADAFLLKPFTEETLIQTVAKLIAPPQTKAEETP